MTSITIRNLGERTKEQLRVRAAHHRRSMEEEARTILRKALTEHTTGVSNLADSIHARFAKLGGIELPLIHREPMRKPPAPKR